MRPTFCLLLALGPACLASPQPNGDDDEPVARAAGDALPGIDPCAESPAGQDIGIRLATSGPDQGRPVLARLEDPSWKLRGLQIRAFVSSGATAKFLESTQGFGQETLDAQRIFGEAELRAAWQEFGANTLRFQVSQHDLDASDRRDSPDGLMPPYNNAYKRKVFDAIQLARQHCFVVIVSMQAQKRSGVIQRKTLASTSTRRAWQNLLSDSGDALGSQLLTDGGVLLEIYNEPGGPNQTVTTELWRDWAHASQNTPAFQPASSRAPDDQIFGMQPMIDYLRDLGAENVLVVDGLKIADTFAGVDSIQNPLRDSLRVGGTDQLAYAVHPYLRGETDDDDATRDARFGFLRDPGSNGRPAVVVMSTEWGAKPGNDDLGLGSPPDFQAAVDLLNYFQRRRLPMGAGAMDIEGVMTQQPAAESPPRWVPSNYDNYAANMCNRTRNNAGLLVATLFKTNYARLLTQADGRTPDQATPIWCP